MSERLNESHEEMPKMKLELAGAEFDSTPENTSLFAYLGRLACYNHVFIQTGQEDEHTISGTYVFSTHPTFEQMAEFMSESGYPMHVNLREVADCDLDAYDTMIKQQTGDIDHIPEGW